MLADLEGGRAGGEKVCTGLGSAGADNRSGRLVRYFIMSPVMVSTPSAPGAASEPLRLRLSFATSLVDMLLGSSDRSAGWPIVHGVEGALILIL